MPSLEKINLNQGKEKNVYKIFQIIVNENKSYFHYLLTFFQHFLIPINHIKKSDSFFFKKINIFKKWILVLVILFLFQL